MALYIPAVGESYDCAKAAISLERSNSFPWPKDCVQIHQTPFPSQRVGSGDETNVPRPFPRACVVGSGNETNKMADLYAKSSDKLISLEIDRCRQICKSQIKKI